MLRRIIYLIPVLLLVAGGAAYAASVQCVIQTGASGPLVPSDCSQQLSSFTTYQSWGNVLPATSGELSGTLNGAIDGDAFTVTSSDPFVGADNTALAWSGTQWIPAGFVTNATTYAGQFNSETTPTGGSTNTPGLTSEPLLGDNLLGILAPAGYSTGVTTATITFMQTLDYVEFQVSSAVNVNYTASLVAFDSLGDVLGTYTVTDTGGGGTCAGLANRAGPQPCNDAPFVQFYDPQDNIKSVELIMNDPNGAYIDTLEVGPIPEPSSSALLGIGILALLWAAKRGHLSRVGILAASKQD